MNELAEVIDEFLAKRAEHRRTRDAEERAYYTAQSAKEAIFQKMQLNPYDREHFARVGKAIRERDNELTQAREKTNG